MWISKYFIYFSVFSVLGWIYETTYVTAKTGKWDNRGFLFGPVCPIYGSGGVGIAILFDALARFGYMESVTWWQIFIISYIGSIFLEYPTHWFLEKRFHAYWWDYSNVPLNIKGRICVPASIGFGCAGVLIYYFIYPAVANVINQIPGIWMELLALIAMGVLAADIALTVAALTNIVRFIEGIEESVDRQMEMVVEEIGDKKSEMGTTITRYREKLTREQMEVALNRMGGLRKSALTRIKGFHPYEGLKSAVTHERMKVIWSMAKERKFFAKIKRDTEKGDSHD